MDDPIKVTAQIPLPAPSTTTTTTPSSGVRSQSRPRARVDPSSIQTAGPSRPTIRSSPSTASLRSSHSSTSTPTTAPTRPALSHVNKSSGSTTPIHRLVRAHSQTPPVTPTTPVVMGPPTSLRRGLTAPVKVKTMSQVSPEHPAISRMNSEPDTSKVTARVRARSRAGSELYEETRSPIPPIPTLTASVSTPVRVTALRSSEMGNDSMPLLSPASLTLPIPPSPILDQNTYNTRMTSSPEPSTSTPPPKRDYPLSATPTPNTNHFPHNQHPTASCPSSPLPLGSRFPDNIPEQRHSKLQDLSLKHFPQRSSTPELDAGHHKSTSMFGDRIRRRIPLPFNPNHHPPSLPLPPSSPELKTIDLPSLTPVRSRAGSMDRDSPIPQRRSLEITLIDRRFSGSSDGRTIEFPDLEPISRSDRDRLSGSTVVNDDPDFKHFDGEKSPDEVDIVLGTDAEQAKINRKIADLEISNASLMAINRSLEATKAKQRSELLKLRRLVRTSLPGYTGLNILLSSQSSQSATSPETAQFTEFESEDAYEDEEIEDPELEERWDKISQVVLAMRKRGEEAVSMEGVKLPGQRVLQWTDKFEDEDGGGGDLSRGGSIGESGTPSRDDL